MFNTDKTYRFGDLLRAELDRCPEEEHESSTRIASGSAVSTWERSLLGSTPSTLDATRVG